MSTTSTTTGKIAEALAKAQTEMKSVHFNKVNPHFKSKYADLSAILDAVLPALNKHGIALTQGTDVTEAGTLIVTTTLFHSSGEWIMGRYPVIADKAGPQALGSATTYAKRYALSAMVGVAADEDDDGNEAEEPKQQTKAKAETAKPVPLWERDSFELPAGGDLAAWVNTFCAATGKAPNMDALGKLEGDNKPTLIALDEALYGKCQQAMNARAESLMKKAS